MLASANILQPLITVFEAVIKFFHNSVGVSWGFSIVLLTVTIRACLIPLTVKQFSSMRAMQTLQPRMKAIQAQYKEDKQRQQQEMMKLYKDNNVNPFASCLPLVAQLPVFYSLFFMLHKNLREDICPQIQSVFQKHYASLHGAKAAVGQTIACGPKGHAGFLFINDLTNNAKGGVLAVLIILYVGTQLGSTVMMQQPTMDQTQRRLMMFLPLVFVLFIIRFPAGVIVYWITTNGWTMAQQFVIKRRLGPVVPLAVEDAPAGGRAGRSSGSGSSGGPSTRKPPAKRNGNGNGRPVDAEEEPPASGLGSLRARLKPPTPEPASVAGNGGRGNGSGSAASPPPSPRKKKKRSGKR